jgi:hypothetical protein
MSREAEAIVNDFSITSDGAPPEVESCATQSFADEAYDEFKCRHERRQDRLDAKHDQVLHDAAPLLEGSPPLMALLDASADGKADGRVSERDMRRFLVAYKLNEQTESKGAYPYTPDNAQYVSDLLDGKYPHITGSNFTGFSAEALCRRAGLEKFIVHHAEDYNRLAKMFQDKLHPAERAQEAAQPEAAQPEAAQPEGVQPEVGRTAAVESTDQARSERSEAGEPPAGRGETDRRNSSAGGVDLGDTRDASRMTFDQVKDMCTFRQGEGYWHVAKRLLNAGFPADDRASDQEIMKLTNALMKLSGHTMDSKGRPYPMVHPGDLVVDFSGKMSEFSTKIPRLAESLHNLHKANIQMISELQ